MPLFGSSHTTLSRDQFFKTVEGLRSFGPYKSKVGAVVASYLAGGLFQDTAKRADGTGFWGPLVNVNATITVMPNTIIKIKSKDDLKKLEDKLDTLILSDKGLIDVREGQIAKLLQKAKDGLLLQELNNGNTEPEVNYYTAPPPRVPATGAPPIPPRLPKFVNLDKAVAWATKGVQGTTTAFVDAIRNNLKSDGKFPLGPNEHLTMSIWGKLVNNAPAYRLPTLGSMYPSSFGGLHLLKWVLTKINEQTLPPLHDEAWVNWALFFFGTLMTAQPFPDGNKRISRVSYAIIMASAEIPFKAPTNKFGGKLAAM